MSNSTLYNDAKLKSLEVTDALKIPVSTGLEFTKNIGREGEIKFNSTETCLMVKTSKEWMKIPLRQREEQATAPPYFKLSESLNDLTSQNSQSSVSPPAYSNIYSQQHDGKKTMTMNVEKKCVFAVFSDIVESLIFPQLNFLLEEAKRLKIKKINLTSKTASLESYLNTLNLHYSCIEDGTVLVTL